MLDFFYLLEAMSIGEESEVDSRLGKYDIISSIDKMIELLSECCPLCSGKASGNQDCQAAVLLFSKTHFTRRAVSK